MKVLILTVTTGQGHNATAAALQKKITETGAECTVIDACYYINKCLGIAVDKGYLLSVDLLAGCYSAVYGILEKRTKGSFDPTVKFWETVSVGLRSCIDMYEPDVIVCTHVFAAIPALALKNKGLTRATLIGVITDLTIHPYWEEVTGLDYIVTPSERLSWQGVRKGFKKKQMLPFGIPIKEKFATVSDKAEARRSLGLYPDKPVVLVMGGSMGYGELSKTVKRIDKLRKCFQTAVVCGSAADELKKLNESHLHHKTLKLGFTDKVDVLMDAADCIITKPGGITASEALAKGLPMILTTPIPGHEERNLTFLSNSGAAMAVSDNCPVDELLWQFLSDGELRASMAEAARAIGKPNAARDLAEFLVSLDGRRAHAGKRTF